MDEKTVIAGRTGVAKENATGSSALQQPAPSSIPDAAPSPEAASPGDDYKTVIAPQESVVVNLKPKSAKGAAGADAKKKDAAAQAKKNAGGNPPAKPASAPAAPSHFPVFALAAVALVLIGLGSAITTVYILSPGTQQTAVAGDADLGNDIVAVQTAESEAEDEALIRAAIKPRIIDLSGDPVIVRQLSNAPRQMIKLESPPQIESAQALGFKSEVYRLKDVLDVPNGGLQAGVLGAQEDISYAQTAELQESGTGAMANVDDQAEEGSSVILASAAANRDRVAEFAQTVKAQAKISEALKGLGLDAEQSQLAEQAFESLYNRDTLQKDDKFAVRAIPVDGQPNQLRPVQVSVYSEDELVGSIAINDIDAFARSEDPWYQRDIFEAQLLPEEADPNNQPRLLDAIYAAALRNRLPTPVVGETIMLLSRAQDLEQKVQPGDTITIVYSPTARDAKSGLGRVVFVSIGRSSGNLDCYVLQQSVGAQFECVSLAGESSITDGGMVTPVNGIVVAKFGPQANGDGGQEHMNFGVDWTAPVGSPVVAAFAGDVTSAGLEKGLGTVVRLTHSDGKTTMYGYLQRVAPGITVGAKMAAGQVIGFVGTPASSREPRLHFELQRNGVPVDPVGEMQANVGAGGAVDQFVKRIIYIESGNRCDARNPKSTAVGLGQFIESTWMLTIRLHRPDLLARRSRREVLDMRTNCELARAMTTAFTRDNAAVIRQTGHPVTPGNLYLAHFLGVSGAIKVLGSNQTQQISAVFGEAHVRANPFERGKSTGYLVAWAAKKMGGKMPAAGLPPGSNSSSQSATAGGTPAASETLAKYASDPVFAQLKSAVTTFLQ